MPCIQYQLTSKIKVLFIYSILICPKDDLATEVAGDSGFSATEVAGKS
jgi:hypothetical protein